MKFIPKNKDGDILYMKLFGRISLLIVITTLLYFLLVNYISPTEGRYEARGTFGDLFGGINAIFSGLAFAGVIVTILMQMKELELTRVELRKSAEAQDKSQKALNSQLKNMQSTTRIESIKNIADIYDKRNETDKREIAKSVLERLTESILYEEAFIDIVTPTFQLSNNPTIHGKKVPNTQTIKYQAYDPSKENSTIIEFVNNGISFKIKPLVVTKTNKELNIRLYQLNKEKSRGGGITTTTSQLPSGKIVGRNTEFRMFIGNITNEKQINIEFEIEGEFVNHKFTRNMVLVVSNGNLTIELQNIQIQTTDENK